VVVLFGIGAFSRVEVDRWEDPESVELIENAGDCEAAGIGRQNDQLLRVEMLEDRCVSNGLFSLPKCEFGIPSSLRFVSGFVRLLAVFS